MGFGTLRSFDPVQWCHFNDYHIETGIGPYVNLLYTYRLNFSSIGSVGAAHMKVDRHCIFLYY